MMKWIRRYLWSVWLGVSLAIAGVETASWQFWLITSVTCSLVTWAIGAGGSAKPPYESPVAAAGSVDIDPMGTTRIWVPPEGRPYWVIAGRPNAGPDLSDEELRRYLPGIASRFIES